MLQKMVKRWDGHCIVIWLSSRMCSPELGVKASHKPEVDVLASYKK